MVRYVALLRGTNLGSRNKVSMVDLRLLFVDLGHSDVSTYVQSGNVIFTPPHNDAARLTTDIEKRIAQDLGVSAAVLLRSRDDLTRIAASNPFADRGTGLVALHMTFLASAPDQERVAQIDPSAGTPDEFLIDGCEIYLHCPNGYGRSKLSNAFFEKQFNVVATTLNWRTVTTLQELANSGPRPPAS